MESMHKLGSMHVGEEGTLVELWRDELSNVSIALWSNQYGDKGLAEMREWKEWIEYEHRNGALETEIGEQAGFFYLDIITAEQSEQIYLLGVILQGK